ncbi:MAG TPA: peptidoglycan-associated lipoprotein Pal [bacterium]
MKTKLLVTHLILAIMAGMILGCGGQKEVIDTAPEPFPEPPPVVEQPRPQPPTTQPAETDIPKKEALVLLTVNFDFDKSDLTPEGRAILADNARKLEQNPEVFIRLEGHCDERGTVEYNLALGERRARSVRDYLVNFGIGPGRMTVISYGKERPVDPGQNESAWAKNRRAEFVILN